jgi:hypothetical protein
MAGFDVEAFVSELAGLDMRLTAAPMADGTLKIYGWRLMGAFEHAKQIEALWSSQIGNDRARMDLLAAQLVGTAGQAAPLGRRA